MIRDDNEITQTIDWNRELWGIYVRRDALIPLSNGIPNIYENISSQNVAQEEPTIRNENWPMCSDFANS